MCSVHRREFGIIRDRLAKSKLEQNEVSYGRQVFVFINFRVNEFLFLIRKFNDMRVNVRAE